MKSKSRTLIQRPSDGWNTAREPTHPGIVLREEFLTPLGIKQTELAHHIGCEWKLINRLVNKRCGLTPHIAYKLACTFGTSAEFWLNLQMAFDLFHARQKVKTPPSRLRIKF